MVLIQVLKGRKKLGKPTACKPSYLSSDVHLGQYECQAPKTRNWKDLFSTAGAHTIQMTYKKPIEGVEFKNFATLKVNVLKLKQGAANNPYVAWGTDHDMKLSVTTVEETVTNSNSRKMGYALAAVRASLRQDIPFLTIRTWFKRTKSNLRATLTCLYKGKRVAEGHGIGGNNYNYWSYIKKRSPKRNEAVWSQEAFQLHMMKPRPGPNGKGSWSKPPHWLNENPGEYKCVVLAEGEVIKEIYFTVGKDGEVIKPECQLKSANTLSSVTFARTVDKKLSDRKYDKKVGKKYGFEGRVTWAKECPPVN